MPKNPVKCADVWTFVDKSSKSMNPDVQNALLGRRRYGSIPTHPATQAKQKVRARPMAKEEKPKARARAVGKVRAHEKVMSRERVQVVVKPPLPARYAFGQRRSP